MNAKHESEGLKYGVGETAKTAQTLEVSAFDLGPSHNGQHVLTSATTKAQAKRLVLTKHTS